MRISATLFRRRKAVSVFSDSLVVKRNWSLYGCLSDLRLCRSVMQHQDESSRSVTAEPMLPGYIQPNKFIPTINDSGKQFLVDSLRSPVNMELVWAAMSAYCKLGYRHSSAVLTVKQEQCGSTGIEGRLMFFLWNCLNDVTVCHTVSTKGCGGLYTAISQSL